MSLRSLTQVKFSTWSVYSPALLDLKLGKRWCSWVRAQMLRVRWRQIASRLAHLWRVRAPALLRPPTETKVRAPFEIMEEVATYAAVGEVIRGPIGRSSLGHSVGCLVGCGRWTPHFPQCCAKATFVCVSSLYSPRAVDFQARAHESGLTMALERIKAWFKGRRPDYMPIAEPVLEVSNEKR